MSPARALTLAFILALGPFAVAADPPAVESRIAAQVDPGADLASLYPEAGHIGMAIAIVPDPHVPRYRRLFDLEVQAITLGMLHDGYVLDRYAFPWSGTISGGEPKNGAADTDKAAYGLMIFRCDG